MATQPEYQNVEFTSIVLDECDGARNIIEQDDEPRWQNINHFYMDKEFKETAKEALGFNQVPFYVVLNEKGEIVQKGSKKNIDFDEVPGIVRPEPEDKENVAPSSNEAKVEEITQQMEHVFRLDDFDF